MPLGIEIVGYDHPHRVFESIFRTQYMETISGGSRHHDQ